MPDDSKPTNLKSQKLQALASKMAFLKKRKELLAELLANWPSAEEICNDPQRYRDLVRAVAEIERDLAKYHQAEANSTSPTLPTA